MARARDVPPPLKSLRLFVAVEVPAVAKDGLAQLTAPFRDRIPGARWTNQSGWHVTVKFLGTTWPRTVDPVRDALGAVAARTAPFSSALTRIGAFPSPGRARVVWAGLADPDGRFGPLAADLDAELEQDFPPEDRAFSPHLTLARLQPSRAIGEFAPELLDLPVASAPFCVDRLVLYRSHLSSRGATYEPVMEAPLAGASSA